MKFNGDSFTKRLRLLWDDADDFLRAQPPEGFKWSRDGMLVPLDFEEVVIRSPLVQVPQSYELFDRLPHRTELLVLPADDPSRLSIGFTVLENIGIGAFNPVGLRRLTIDRGDGND